MHEADVALNVPFLAEEVEAVFAPTRRKGRARSADGVDGMSLSDVLAALMELLLSLANAMLTDGVLPVPTPTRP